MVEIFTGYRGVWGRTRALTFPPFRRGRGTLLYQLAYRRCMVPRLKEPAVQLGELTVQIFIQQAFTKHLLYTKGNVRLKDTKMIRRDHCPSLEGRQTKYIISQQNMSITRRAFSRYRKARTITSVEWREQQLRKYVLGMVMSKLGFEG